ncbi:hypothetical protein I79_026210 [Cricetulus griseus]|uniref:Uncharacterized protein n=1 Tax=Cricetulus griseus TaxID=10029 RepID=G3IQA6_CRIGR|nr:hypothetical protein I79_026210 [Cricetulus griseus]
MKAWGGDDQNTLYTCVNFSKQQVNKIKVTRHATPPLVQVWEVPRIFNNQKC